MIKKASILFLTAIAGTLSAQNNIETIDRLLLFAQNDLSSLENQWLSVENNLLTQLEQATNALLKQQLLEKHQAQQEAIEYKIEEVEKLIEQLKQKKEFLLNPPLEPVVSEPVIETEPDKNIEEIEEEALEQPTLPSDRREVNKNKPISMSRSSSCPAESNPCTTRTESPALQNTLLNQEQDPRFRCNRDEQLPLPIIFINLKPTTNTRKQRFSPRVLCSPETPQEQEKHCPPGVFRRP
ncbi:hypothetical protein KKA53_03950 [Candidatus Dependentiae bacterium]|nr:hypothetical protein [Candidatus Dependentiae bacterium]